MFIIANIGSQAPNPGEGIRLALLQNEAGESGNRKAIDINLKKLETAVKQAKQFNAHILSTAEMFLTGYAVTPEIVKEFAETQNGPSLQKTAQMAKKNEIAILLCYPEKATVAGSTHYYDAMALFDKNGTLLRNYRKTHLWGPYERENFSFGYVFPEEGEAYTVVKVNEFPIGLLNCYEAEFPELSRIYALKGANLVIIPTAADEYTVSQGGQKTHMPYPDISKTLIPSNAYQNIYFQAYNNRYGIETYNGKKNGKYLGNSVIADPHGKLLVAAPHDKECVLIADCIPADYGPTHPQNTNYIKNRRPELYSELILEKIAYEDYIYQNPPE
jgi:predicted amidohydrolase